MKTLFLARGITPLVLFVCLFSARSADDFPHKEPTLKVAIRDFAPYAYVENGETKGFCVDVLNAICEQTGWTYSWTVVPTLHDMLSRVVTEGDDLGVGALMPTWERTQLVDFSNPYNLTAFHTLAQKPHSPAWLLLRELASLATPRVFLFLAISVLAISLTAFCVHQVALRLRGDTFHPSYGENVWWSVKTVLTHNCAPANPSTFPGRFAAIATMVVGTLLTAQLTAVITASVVQAADANAAVTGLSDLYKKRVGTLRDSEAERYLLAQFISTIGYPTIEQAIDALEHDAVDAVVFDTAVLQTAKERSGYEDLYFVEPPFGEHPHAMLLQKQSPYLATLNTTIRELKRSGELARLREKWFGGSERQVTQLPPAPTGSWRPSVLGPLPAKQPGGIASTDGE